MNLSTFWFSLILFVLLNAPIIADETVIEAGYAPLNYSNGDDNSRLVGYYFIYLFAMAFIGSLIGYWLSIRKGRKQVSQIVSLFRIEQPSAVFELYPNKKR